MPRDNFKRARIEKRLTHKQLALRLGIDWKTISNWETGKTTPHLDTQGKVEEELGHVGDPHLWDITANETQAPLPCVTSDSSDRLDSSDSPTDIPESEEGLSDMDKTRRGITTTIVASTIAAGTGIGLVNSTQIITGPIVEADEYLDIAKTSIPIWWQWLNTGNYLELERALNKHVPVLKRLATTRLATTISPFQKEAASLAVEAKIMQIHLANRNLEFSQRERHCYDAVQMGTLSGDKNLLALAQYWYGDTFTYCYNEPEIAIEKLNDALSNVANVDGNVLIATRIYSDLSIAHAQKGDETNALGYAKLARSTMPSHPILDDCLYDVGHAELDQMLGKAYLYLAESLPDAYAQQAYNAFDKSVNKSTDKGWLVQALIRKADASRALGEKDECTITLTQAFEKASSISRLTQINDVLHRVPDSWQKETVVQELQKEVLHALVVARQ